MYRYKFISKPKCHLPFLKVFCYHSRTKDGSEFLFHAKDEVRNSIVIIFLILFSSSHRLPEFLSVLQKLWDEIPAIQLTFELNRSV